MLDADLSALYGVRTKHLNQQVKRNPERFPADFVFQLTREDAERLEHVPGANGQFRGRHHRQFAFTEPGAGMLASVLRSPTASRVSIEILRAFARVRQDEEPTESPDAWRVRSLFAAIRDAVLLLPGDQEFTTDEAYTYFVQAGDAGPTKIGSTRNLLVRLRSLATMSPVPLKLLGIMKGDRAEELCHARLAAFRIHGEWFLPWPAVLDFIRDNAMAPERCQSVRTEG